MAKAAQFASWFFAACAANSLLSWLAVLSPSGAAITKFFYLSLVLLILAAILLDDGIQPLTGLEPQTYYAAIAIAALSALIGGCLIWINQ
ncbi:MAG: hypothetical protein RLZZ511_1933 [Cyanobacteriota bacterium]|jgi:hypothetical protein